GVGDMSHLTLFLDPGSPPRVPLGCQAVEVGLTLEVGDLGPDLPGGGPRALPAQLQVLGPPRHVEGFHPLPVDLPVRRRGLLPLMRDSILRLRAKRGRFCFFYFYLG